MASILTNADPKPDYEAERRRRRRIRRAPRVDGRYLAFIRSLACLVCGHFRVDAHHEPFKSNASDWHDWWTIPLCAECHTFGSQARHRMSKEAFEAILGYSIDSIIEHLQRIYVEKVRKK